MPTSILGSKGVGRERRGERKVSREIWKGKVISSGLWTVTIIYIIYSCFVFCQQSFMEGVAGNDRFSTPIRVFVPVLYNARRVFTLTEWLRDEFAKEDKEYSGSVRRQMIGRGLAVVNMAVWSFNLFGILLPLYVPKALKRYYSVKKSKD